jgi:hypothetical protein
VYVSFGTGILYYRILVYALGLVDRGQLQCVTALRKAVPWGVVGGKLGRCETPGVPVLSVWTPQSVVYRGGGMGRQTKKCV